MYTKKSKIISNRQELSNYISGNDVYNASILSLINDPSIERVSYLIQNYEYRPDLIAVDFYGSSDYLSMLLLQTARGLETFKKESVLRLIPKDVLDRILNNI